MSYEDLMARIAREIPELAGKLTAPRVTYVKSLKKTYITFESEVLAGEKQFLKLEAILRELFPPGSYFDAAFSASCFRASSMML